MPDASREIRPNAEQAAGVVLPLLLGKQAPRLPGAHDAEGILQLPGRPVYAVLRAGGKKVAEAWGRGASWEGCIASAVRNAGQNIKDNTAGNGGPKEELLRDISTIELNLTHSYRTLSSDALHETLDVSNRGVLGIRIHRGDLEVQVAPGDMVANNVGFEDATMLFFTLLEQQLGKQAEEQSGQPSSDDAIVEVFEADQILIALRPQPAIATLHRGGITVPIERITRSEIQGFADRMASWLEHEVADKGWLTYLYHPSLEEASPENAIISQCTATLGLVCSAVSLERPRLVELAERNIAYNLDTYCRSDDTFGFIEFEDEVRLGSSALTALAMLELGKEHLFVEEREALTRFTIGMWRENGSFQTFYKSDRSRQQNFYPGEALLLWAALLKQNSEPDLLRKFMTSVNYYSGWHRENPHPAFVIWHTLAYCRLLGRVKKESLQKRVLEMNDWLLGWQQWETARYPDEQGRFYVPAKANTLPPHGAYTAGFLLALTAAYELTRSTGDLERAAQYRTAIVRGLRSLLQLEFRNDVDMYYVEDKKRLRGALRSSIFDNRVRVDTTPMALMAVSRILEAFSEKDFLSPTGSLNAR